LVKLSKPDESRNDLNFIDLKAAHILISNEEKVQQIKEVAVNNKPRNFNQLTD